MPKTILLVNFGENAFLSGVSEKLEVECDVRQINFSNSSHSSGTFSPTPSMCSMHLQAYADRLWPQNLNSGIWPLDVNRAVSERASLSCDRVFPVPFPRGEIVGYLSNLASLLATALDFEEIDLAIFHATPHMPWEIVLEGLLACHGVKTLALRATQLDDRIVISSLPFNFEDDDFLLRPSSASTHNLATTFKEGSGSARLRVARAINDSATPTVGRFLFRMARATGSSVAKVVSGRQTTAGERGRVDVRFSFRQGAAHHWSYASFWELVLWRLQALTHFVKLQKELESVVLPVPEGQFFYFPLQFQPEQNTDPESSRFRFQIASVRFVRELLDEAGFGAIPLVVKEHPRQLGHPSVLLKNFRPRGFYRRIGEIDRTFLVRAEEESGELIRRSVLTISATGSGPWEALSLNKPSLTLASTWHSGCEASPSLARLRRGERSLAELASMTSEQVDSAVMRFMESEQITFSGVTQPRHLTGRSADLERCLADEIAALIAAE